MRHSHDFNDANPLAEQRTRLVVLLTVIMMVVEISAGWIFQSMALLADGWHMSSHAIALGLSAAAYTLARRLQRDERFAFGTWKIEILGGYTSAIFLVGVVVYMGYESVTRLMHPAPIAFDQAIGIACLGFLVNLASAWLLAGAGGAGHSHGHTHSARPHAHDHDHEHEHDHGHAHHDLNLRSAFVHVAADAVTSVLAIGALAGGKYFGAAWLDPVMGIIGSLIVAAWAFTLLRDTGRILLDAEMDAPVVAGIKESLCRCRVPATIEDLHVWRVGKGKFACVLSVETAEVVSSDEIRSLLSVHQELTHVTVEVNRRAER
ncbi:MAG: CDF family Co(II)/Ni(II) efflux transporter DmeF [Steroidobacteraceae bacterium]